jgi:hypothetical protein
MNNCHGTCVWSRCQSSSQHVVHTLECKFECITTIGECSVGLYLEYFPREMTMVQHLYIMDDPSL